MTISFVQAGQGATVPDGSTYAMQITKPSLAQAGDTIIVATWYGSSGPIVGPEGFKNEGTIGRSTIWSRTIQDGDASWKWTGGGASTYGIYATYRGAHQAVPVEVLSGTASSIVAPSVTSGADNSHLLCYAFVTGATGLSFTPPGGMTERSDVAPLGVALAQTFTDVALPTAGATGTKTFTKSGGTDQGAISIVIAPPPPPTVTVVDPPYGPLAGATAVTVTGTGFTPDTTLTFGGAAATSVSVQSATSLTCVTPAGTAGAKDVVATNSGGSGTLEDGFTYVQVRDANVKLLIAGSVSAGDNKAKAIDWPATSAYTSYGAQDDDWGETLTPSVVNNANFGVVLNATVGASAIAKVDHIQMKVFYTLPGARNPSTLLAVMRVAADRQTVKPELYKLPRTGFTVANDPQVNKRTSGATFYDTRYYQPQRALEKIYRNHTFWADFDAENENHPGLEVWARIDEGQAFQLTEANGNGTLRSTGPKEVFFPPDDRARGHYCQVEYRIPALVGDQVEVAVSIRDRILRCVPRPRKTIPVNFTVVCTDGEHEDRGSTRRTAQQQLAALEALSRPGYGPVVIRDDQGEEFYAVIKKVTSREVEFKPPGESRLIAYVLAWRLDYG